uniref:Uncharacterized protein n=1 Tax=Neobodo designis TaxID=312471 RepID=A0A7S1L819_NEODS
MSSGDESRLPSAAKAEPPKKTEPRKDQVPTEPVGTAQQAEAKKRPTGIKWSFPDVADIMPGITSRRHALKYFVSRTMRVQGLNCPQDAVLVMIEKNGSATVGIKVPDDNQIAQFQQTLARLQQWYAACVDFRSAIEHKLDLTNLCFCWGGALTAPAIVFLRNPVNSKEHWSQFDSTTGYAWWAAVLWAKLAVCVSEKMLPSRHRDIDRIAHSAVDLTPLADEGWPGPLRDAVETAEAGWEDHLSKQFGVFVQKLIDLSGFKPIEGKRRYTIFLCDQTETRDPTYPPVKSTIALFKEFKQNKDDAQGITRAVVRGDGWTHGFRPGVWWRGQEFNVAVLPGHPSRMSYPGKDSQGQQRQQQFIKDTFATVFCAVYYIMTGKQPIPADVKALDGVGAFKTCVSKTTGKVDVGDWIPAARNKLDEAELAMRRSQPPTPTDG